MSFPLLLVHLGVAAAWLGSMGYSLFVVQPRIARASEPGARAGEPDGRAERDPVRAEELYRELAAGNRWLVVGLIATLALSGAGLIFVQTGQTYGWWLAIAAKVLLLATASGLFWWVSWRAWPRRIFALPDELAGLQARFRRVALAMAGVVATAFVLGVAASHLTL